MKTFFKYTGEFLRTYPQIKITKTDEVLIRNSVKNYLGLDNLNQLRDRFEGQSFFEKTRNNICALMALQKHLNISLIDLKTTDLSNFKPTITLNNEVIDINLFEFGSLPLVKADEINNSIYFVMQKDTLTFLLCGYASKNIIK